MTAAPRSRYAVIRGPKVERFALLIIEMPHRQILGLVDVLPEKSEEPLPNIAAAPRSLTGSTLDRRPVVTQVLADACQNDLAYAFLSWRLEFILAATGPLAFFALPRTRTSEELGQ
jgi:hypothetical protein